jgi:ribosomal protein S18 acetylase RimI-like enzyme
MIQLQAMSEAAYGAFMQAHFKPYAADRMQADFLTQEQADAFVRRQTADTLPQGRATPGHHFYDIIAEEGRAGSLWLRHAPGEREAFVFDIVIEPRLRRRGYAGAALREAQRQLREAGCEVLGLNVFAHNPGAQALYAKLGFKVASSYMNVRL